MSENGQTIKSIIEDVCSQICDELCKYREAIDDEGICGYIQEHGECPLDRLQ